MKTAVLMKRKLFDGMISQHSKTEMFSATDLIKVGNKWRVLNDLPQFSMKAWLQNKGTQEFIEELETRYGKENVRKMARGRGHHTWFHPLLFIDMALSISPKLKLETYEWMYDSLIKFRNESGDSYKLMCGSLYARAKDKTNFRHYVTDTAKKIKLACNVKDWNEATEDQLKKRDKIQENIALLSDVLNSNDQAVRLAILKTAK